MFDEARDEFRENFNFIDSELQEFVDEGDLTVDQRVGVAQAAATMCLLSGLEELRRSMQDIYSMLHNIDDAVTSVAGEIHNVG